METGVGGLEENLTKCLLLWLRKRLLITSKLSETTLLTFAQRTYLAPTLNVSNWNI